jgi:hypothetical protein
MANINYRFKRYSQFKLKEHAMENTGKQKIERLITNCKAELLNHTLQGEVLSPHLKKINSYMDECLDIVRNEWVQESTGTAIRRFRSGERSRIGEMDRENILFFAYCMSKWDYQFVCAITGNNFNQGEAFEYLADKIGVKVNTLKNYRDTFDSHVNQMRSNRQGWKKSLSDDFIAVKEKYDSYNEDQLIAKGKELLLDEL